MKTAIKPLAQIEYFLAIAEIRELLSYEKRIAIGKVIKRKIISNP
jgi:hypothetical protein